MTYVISDIHGEYGKFLKMLDLISFGERDVMYILGNIIDYGEDSVELLSDLSMRYNIISIAGKHEFRAAKLLAKIDNMLKNNTNFDQKDKDAIAAMMQDGGEKTARDFSKLSEEMREGILDYLADLPLYEEIEAAGKSYLLVSAGLGNFSPETPLEDYSPEDFLQVPLNHETQYFSDKTIIAGTTPTSTFASDKSDKIYYGKGSIFINCGTANGGKLACLCLENKKEYYI